MPAHRLVWSPPPRILRPADPGWPDGLRDLGDRSPAQLLIAGQLPSFEGAVAIVGTRYSDDDGVEFARGLSAELAAAGRVILSGGARGIDAAAHAGALDAGGVTVAVLATGLTRPYPPQHGPLFVRIAEGGALVTEREGEPPPIGSAFLARNRLIAALAEVVVVVQAPARSGALSTAALAAELERPVFTVPYPPWLERGRGCLALLRKGARICTSTRDILSLPLRRGRTDAHSLYDLAGKIPRLEPLSEDCRAVLGALRRRPRHPDELTVSLGLHILKVQQALTQLLLLDLVVERGPGKYSKRIDPDQR